MNTDEKQFSVTPAASKKQIPISKSTGFHADAETAPIPQTELTSQSAAQANVSSVKASPQVSRTAGQSHTGLKWMNGVYLVLWGRDLASRLFTGDVSLFLILICVPFIAALLFGFLAARKPNLKATRKLAKWSNSIVLAFALFGLLLSVKDLISTGIVGRTALSVLTLSIITGIPAFINFRAFWRQPSIRKPPASPDKEEQFSESANRKQTENLVESLETERTESDPDSRHEPPTSEKDAGHVR